MAIRTTESAVIEALGEAYTSNPNPFTSMSACIQTASFIVDDLCDPANVASSTYTAARLELIERWLSAHFYFVDIGHRREEIQFESEQEFFDHLDQGIASTVYGRKAIDLDTLGFIAANNNAKKNQDAILTPAKRTIRLQWLGSILEEND